MTISLERFIADSGPWIAGFNAWVKQMHPPACVDHICWKCASSEEFEAWRAVFESVSPFIYQSLIAGRRIAVIALPQRIMTDLGEIRFLELSDQKPDGSQKSGFDHLEIYPTHGSASALCDVLTEQGMIFEKIVRPHHTTYDARIEGGPLMRLEDEPLIEKIKREEMKSWDTDSRSSKMYDDSTHS